MNTLNNSQSIPHTLPLQLETITVINNMPKLTESRQITSQNIIKQDWQGSVSRVAEPLENFNMPGITGWHRNGIIAMNPFQNILDSAIKLGNKGSRGGLLSDSRLIVGKIMIQRKRLIYSSLHRIKLNADALQSSYKTPASRFNQPCKFIGG